MRASDKPQSRARENSQSGLGVMRNNDDIENVLVSPDKKPMTR